MKWHNRLFGSPNGRADDYTGRNMALAHAGMGITETNWARFIAIVITVAEGLGVGSNEGGEVIAFLESLKADIVTA